MRKLFTLTLALLASFSLWADLTTKSDFSNGDIFILSKNNIDAATWIEKGSSLTSTGEQTPELMPVAGPTSADVAGTKDTFYKMKKVSDNRQLTLKVSGLTKITFYAHATSTNRILRASVDGGDATNLVTLSTSNKTYKGELSLTTAVHTIVIDLSNEGYVTALKVTAPSGYSITYHCNGAESGCPSDVASGATALPNPLPAAPTKTGYDFDKWYTNEGLSSAAVAGATLSANANLYAGWTVHTHTLAWDFDGGSTTSKSYTAAGTVAYGTAITYPDDNTMSKADEEFAGWDTIATTMPDKNLTIKALWSTSHSISYTNDKGATPESALPTKYYEGIGIESFPALGDVEDFHFNGWSPASIPTTATADPFEVAANWVAAYDVTFSAGEGGGTVPASFQKWEGATFNLPAQGDMTAPSGKVFDGWKANGTGDKLPANTEYTMTASAVEFVAQWKGVPTTIFDWTFASTNNIEADNTDLSNASYGTLTTGISVVGRLFGTNTIAKNSAGYKLANDDVCIEIQGTSTFQEGDTVKFLAQGGGDGERGLSIASSSVTSAANADTARTNLIDDKKNARTYTVIITDKQAGTKIRVFRMAGKTMYLQNIKVIRPAARDTASIDISLSDVKVNNRSIHADSLAIVKTGPSYSLTLKDSYVEAPVIKFNQQKVITYADGESPATKTTNKVYTVTASLVDGNWNAQATINEITYTVTASKPSTYSVVYKDGNKTLDTEVVIVGEHPSGITDPTKAINTFAGWMNGDEVVNPTDLEGTKDQVITLQAQWTKLYATNIDLEAFIDDKGTSGKWDSLLTANNYAISSTNNVSLDAPEGKPADKGLKIKKSGTIVSFNVHAGKMVVLKTGMLSGAQISVDGGTNYTDLTSASSSTGASIVSYHYNAAEATYKIKMTTDAYNIIQSISITDPFTVSCSGTTNGSLSADTLKARPNETITLTVTPDSYEYRITGVTVDGEAIVADQSVYSFAMPAKNVTIAATFAEKDAAPIYWKFNEVVVDAAEVTYGSTPYALPTLDNPNSLTVALASSATDVAEFDGSTLNIKKAGTANISATYTATADGDYKTTVVSYALTVKSGSGTSLDNTAAEIKAVKFIENGQLFIRRGEKVYTITGEEVK